MSKSPFLVITSIADDQHPVLNQYAAACQAKGVPFIVIGDVKSPNEFQLDGCDFYSIEKQMQLPHTLAREIPVKHYARKNIGYLIALQQGANILRVHDVAEAREVITLVEKLQANGLPDLV